MGSIAIASHTVSRSAILVESYHNVDYVQLSETSEQLVLLKDARTVGADGLPGQRTPISIDEGAHVPILCAKEANCARWQAFEDIYEELIWECCEVIFALDRSGAIAVLYRFGLTCRARYAVVFTLGALKICRGRPSASFMLQLCCEGLDIFLTSSRILVKGCDWRGNVTDE